MTTPITNNANPTINNEPEIIPPMVVEPEPAADAEVDTYVSGETDLFELPRVYSDITGDVDENPETISRPVSSTIQELASRDEPTSSLAPEVNNLISNPNIDAEGFTDPYGGPTLINEALSKMSTSDIEAAIENPKYENDLKAQFLARGDMSDQQATDAASKFNAHTEDVFVARVEDEVVNAARPAIQEGVSASIERSESPTARQELAAITRDAGSKSELKQALMDYGVHHRDARGLANDLHGMDDTELNAFENGQKAENFWGTDTNSELENTYRNSQQQTAADLERLLQRGHSGQVQSNVFIDPVYEVKVKEVKAQHTGPRAQALIEGQTQHAKNRSDVNKYGKKLISHGLSMNPLTKAPGKVVEKGVDFAHVRNETDLAYASDRVGGITQKSLDKAKFAENSWHFGVAKDAAKTVVGKPE